MKWWRRFRTRRQLEKQVFQDSEAHYFQLLTASIEKADSRETVRLLYHWYDRYRAENYGPELRSMTDAETAEELRKILLAEAERLYRDDNWEDTLREGAAVRTGLMALKKSDLKQQKQEDESSWLAINPE